jgi:hypothetical protein
MMLRSNVSTTEATNCVFASLWFIYSIFIEITAAPDLLFFTITSLREGKDANNSAGQRVGFDLC